MNSVAPYTQPHPPRPYWITRPRDHYFAGMRICGLLARLTICERSRRAARRGPFLGH